MLSIIIPTLNEENYLPFLLGSIKRQDFRDYEIIVADNNSLDKTVEIATVYGCKVVSGGLPPEGKNEGAKIAKGNLLLFLDADLVLPEGFLSKFLKEFQEKNSDIASTDLDFLTEEKKYKIGVKFFNFFYKYTEGFLPFITQCILVKKELHQKIGGFDEDIKILEDFVYVRKIAKIAKFSHLKNLRYCTSPRRYKTDGEWKTFFKYLLANLYLTFLGPIKSDIFRYRFGHYLPENKNKIK